MSVSSDSFAVGVQMLAQSVALSAVDPDDALRLLNALADAVPTMGAGGTALKIVQNATIDLCRRSAVIALCRASISYQPSSYDDALAVRNLVTGLLDNEITIAGDQGEDASYNALRQLRAAVVTHLTARGADLTLIRQFTVSSSQPALALAQKFYGDAVREEELVTQVNPRHPLFMPLTLRVLAE